MKSFIKGSIIVFSSISIILFSCNGDKDVTSAAEGLIDSSLAEVAENKDRIYTLPAPLQVATSLKLITDKFTQQKNDDNEELKIVFPDERFRAMALGVYITDLGYSTIYSQHGIASQHIKSIQTIMQDLGINSGIQPHMVRRFKQNQQNTDSLCKIILEAYRDAHSYFQANKREDVAMHIITGGYIEGLYLTLATPEKNNTPMYLNLIGQQKLYLQSILQILTIYNNPKVAELVSKLNELNAVFDSIDVKINENSNSVIETNMTETQKLELLKITMGLREYILNS